MVAPYVPRTGLIDFPYFFSMNKEFRLSMPKIGNDGRKEGKGIGVKRKQGGSKLLHEGGNLSFPSMFIAAFEMFEVEVESVGDLMQTDRYKCCAHGLSDKHHHAPRLVSDPIVPSIGAISFTRACFSTRVFVFILQRGE